MDTFLRGTVSVSNFTVEAATNSVRCRITLMVLHTTTNSRVESAQPCRVGNQQHTKRHKDITYHGRDIPSRQLWNQFIQLGCQLSTNKKRKSTTSLGRLGCRLDMQQGRWQLKYLVLTLNRPLQQGQMFWRHKERRQAWKRARRQSCGLWGYVIWCKQNTAQMIAGVLVK